MRSGRVETRSGTATDKKIERPPENTHCISPLRGQNGEGFNVFLQNWSHCRRQSGGILE